MTLEGFSYIAQIVGAVGTFCVAVAALVVSLFALRTQREALPIDARFRFGERIERDQDGVRWIWAWMENTGTHAFVHDVFPSEWKPDDLADELTPNLTRVRMSDSLPPWLRTASRRKVRKALGVFTPRYLRTNSYVMFWVSCPPGVEEVQLTAAMSVSKQDPVRFVNSCWIEVPK